MILCCLFFKQKTAYEMRISDWSSDVCSSDLAPYHHPPLDAGVASIRDDLGYNSDLPYLGVEPIETGFAPTGTYPPSINSSWLHSTVYGATPAQIEQAKKEFAATGRIGMYRSEEHTSELQSLMRTSYAVFCLK